MKRFHLTIVTPEGIYFNGTVSSLVVPGGAGSFGVLADHAPIISTLTQGTLSINEGEEKQEYHVADGFIDVLYNEVTLLTTSIKKKEVVS